MDAGQRGHMETTGDWRRIVAREGLLDVVEALGPHGDAVILVGAQAVYVHTEAEDASFAVSPFTYDADIALDPALLGNSPRIVDAMREAGFGLTDQPGIYRRRDGAQVDLLVPATVGGPGRRGARLSVHGNRAAMKVHGLEGALVSHSSRMISSLVPGERRTSIVKVAGPAALLVAKVHKIAERIDSPSRRIALDKDAFDIFRLLRSHEISSTVTLEALSVFKDLFGALSGVGTELVVRHVAGLEDTELIAASSVALSQDLLDEALQ